MSRTSGNRRSPSRYLGSYDLGDGRHVVGDLELRGEETLLKLHSNEYLPHIGSRACLNGTAFSSECITLIDCFSPGTGTTHVPGAQDRYHADVFPHHVVIGRRHLDPETHTITGIHFSTSDLTTLFYDFDAFSNLIDAKPVIEDVLRERRQMRPVESGDHPLVQYFTGKDCIADVATVRGRVSVHHRPRYSAGGPEGVFIRNRIVVSLEPVEPAPFADVIEGMYDLLCFLSMAAGRTQGVRSIHITTTEEVNDVPIQLAVHASHRPKLTDRSEQRRPHPASIPLDPIQHPDEFAKVLADWMHRQPTWQIARSRLMDCLRKANYYDSERLVAAANMFDILPASAVPGGPELPADLAATRDQCVSLLRAHPPGIDRNSALSALGRLGRPSLPKKVAHFAALVESNTGDAFEGLQRVVSVAIKCRNFLVHGNSDDVDFSKVEPFMPFLTDALEFVFATSDLITAGWDAKRGLSRGGWGHSFGRFRHGYYSELAALDKALAG